MIAEPIQCVFSTDDNYCQHLAVTLASLAENNARHSLVAHIIHHGLSPENRCSLEAHIDAYENLKAEFYEFDVRPYSHFRLDGHISLASYFRLFLTDVLPEDVHRVLYLDADIVVLDDIGPLWSMDLGADLLGAAPDPFANAPTLFAASKEKHPTSNERLGLAPDYSYFNAGILIIDLEGWRKANLLPTFIGYIEKNHAVLRFHDQDVLNAVLGDRVRYVAYGWNFQAKTRYEDTASLALSKKEFRLLAKHPHIVHYTSSKKPWFYAHQVRYEREYLRYLRRTPWRDYAPPDKTPRQMARRHLWMVRWIYLRLKARLIHA